MRVLRLRPRDGWRVFAGEVGVIVLGVLIALAAQQVADDWQWRQTVARTKADLNEQVRSDIVNIAERAAVDRCLRGRLNELSRKVAASRGEWTGDPWRLRANLAGTNSYTVPATYRIPVRNYPIDVWEQAKASGILTHMTQDDISRYALIFDDIADIKASNQAERELSARLSFLSFDGVLSPDTRASALSTIAQLDYHNENIVRTLDLVVGYAAALHSPLSPANDRQLAQFLDRQEKFRGSCVDRAAAMKVLEPLRGRRS